MDHNFGTDVAESYMVRARKLVHAYVLAHLEKTDPQPDFTVYIVWFSKTLQNWKALVSTTLPDKMYYEVTYNGEKKEAYIDAYLKVGNECVKDSEWPEDPNQFRIDFDGDAPVKKISRTAAFIAGLNPAGNDRHA